MRRLKLSLAIVGHNFIGHPIAGLLWLCGLQRAGDWVHSAIAWDGETP